MSVVRTILSVGHNALLIGQLQTYILSVVHSTLSVVHNARSVVNIYSVGSTHYSDHSPFLGKYLKKTR